MQNLSKKMIIPMAAVAIIGAGVYGVAQVSASSDAKDPQASLVQKLADTLNVDKSKVQAVFDEHHSERKAEHEKSYEARLSQAVTDGKITAAQKSAILAKHKELAAEMEAAMKDPNADPRAVKMKLHQETQAWAKQNNIDQKWLMGLGKFHHGTGGHKMMHIRDVKSDEVPAASPSIN